jgi:hypothetical protein
VYDHEKTRKKFHTLTVFKRKMRVMFRVRGSHTEMSLKIEVHLSDLVHEDEALTDNEYAERLSEKIATTIAHYGARGWRLEEASETQDGVVLHFHHKLPDLW